MEVGAVRQSAEDVAMSGMNILAAIRKSSFADATNAIVNFITKVVTKSISKLGNVSNIVGAINVKKPINTQRR
jgi:hypothetical protein